MEEPMTASIDPGESNSVSSERRSSANGLRRNKVSRACDECRKRKVRCNGALPCERCQKSGTACVFNKVTPRRAPPKQYVDAFELRLRALERALDSLVDPQDTKRGRWPSSVMLPSMEPLLTDSDLAQQHPHYPLEIRKDLIHLYFTHVHPYLPILHKDTFLTQHYTSPLLLNAMYAVAARWLTGPEVTNRPQPPGWHFFENAFQLLDTFGDAPRLSTIQALLLLLKYQEHVRRPGFFSRTRVYFNMLVHMAKELGLTHELPNELQTDGVIVAVRRRTFWAIYAYDILMSTEYGSKPHFEDTECTVQYPNLVADELKTEDGEALCHFYRLTALVRVHGSILQFVRQSKTLEQDDTFHVLEQRLNNAKMHLTTGDQSPKPTRSLALSFCLLLVHHSTILLHRPFASTHPASQEKCAHSASSIIQVAQMLSSTSLEWAFYPLRGIQFVIHTLSATLTISKANPNFKNMYEGAMHLVHRLLALTPAQEIIGNPTTTTGHIASHAMAHAMNPNLGHAEGTADYPTQPSSSRSMPLLTANDNGRTRSRRSSNVTSTATGKRRARAGTTANAAPAMATPQTRPMAAPQHHRLSMPIMYQTSPMQYPVPSPPIQYPVPFMMSNSQPPSPTTGYPFNDMYAGTMAAPSHATTSFYKQALHGNMAAVTGQPMPYPYSTPGSHEAPAQTASTPRPAFATRATSPRRHTISDTFRHSSFLQNTQWPDAIPAQGDLLDTHMLGNAETPAVSDPLVPLGTEGMTDCQPESMVGLLMSPSMPPWDAMQP